MKFWASVWRWVDHNRWTVIGPIAGMIIFIVAMGCEPVVESPYTPGKFVNDRGLQIEFKTWQNQTELIALQFESAGQDLTEQKERLAGLKNIIIEIASGGISDMPTLLKLLIEGGAIGLMLDAVRKGGVISGLKRNRPKSAK